MLLCYYIMLYFVLYNTICVSEKSRYKRPAGGDSTCKDKPKEKRNNISSFKTPVCKEMSLKSHQVAVYYLEVSSYETSVFVRVRIIKHGQCHDNKVILKRY